jgi:hypothetical protein
MGESAAQQAATGTAAQNGRRLEGAHRGADPVQREHCGEPSLSVEVRDR